MKKITTKTTVVSSIDTIQTKDLEDNRLMIIDNLLGQTKRKVENGIITTRWSPNYKGIIKRLSDTKNEMLEIYSRAYIINVDCMKMNRIDIHTDIDIKFCEIEKLLDFFFMILTEGMGKDRKEWTNKDDLKKESLWVRTQYLDIEIYNKEKECADKNKKCEFPTRVELRFKKIKSQDMKVHIDKAIGIYTDAIEKFAYAENRRIKVLCSEWDNFIKDNPRGTLTHFVIKYESEIYTRRILKELYMYVGLKGNFKSWIDKFKRGYKLDLITEKEICTLVQRINISLKRYKNN